MAANQICASAKSDRKVDERIILFGKERFSLFSKEGGRYTAFLAASDEAIKTMRRLLRATPGEEAGDDRPIEIKAMAFYQSPTYFIS